MSEQPATADLFFTLSPAYASLRSECWDGDPSPAEVTTSASGASCYICTKPVDREEDLCRGCGRHVCAECLDEEHVEHWEEVHVP